MILNKKYKFIYIHIPKSAGTFITRFCNKSIEGSKKINYDGDTHYGIFKARNRLHNVPLNEYYKFMTVRNPWDWYVSLYEYVKKGNCHEWRLFSKHNNFKQWLQQIANSRSTPATCNMFVNDKTSTATLYKHLHISNLDAGWLTHRYIYSCCIDWKEVFKSRTIESFQKDHDSIVLIDDVFKTETLAADFVDSITKHTDIDPAIVNQIKSFKMQNVNKKRKANYRDYYKDVKLVDLVAHKERFLTERFNYEF